MVKGRRFITEKYKRCSPCVPQILHAQISLIADFETKHIEKLFHLLYSNLNATITLVMEMGVPCAIILILVYLLRENGIVIMNDNLQVWRLFFRSPISWGAVSTIIRQQRTEGPFTSQQATTGSLILHSQEILQVARGVSCLKNPTGRYNKN